MFRQRVIFCPNPGNLGARVCLLEEAGFCPCGPEPSCGYVTETSHPDVELEKVCAGAAQRRARSPWIVSTSLEVFLESRHLGPLLSQRSVSQP